MKNFELFDLEKKLSTLKHLTGRKFTYCIIKNTKKVISAIRELRAQLDVDPEYVTYQGLYKAELTQYNTNRDKIIKGAKVTEDKEEQKKINLEINEKIKKLKLAFDKKVEELEKKYEKVIEASVKEEEKWNKLLNEDTKPDLFHKIKLSDVPDNITTEQMAIISEFVEED